jgi:AraC-like DNA-binding protein
LNIPFSIPVLLIGAVIAQGVFAALVLLFQPTNRKANRYLSLLVLAFSLWLCDTFFRVADIYRQDPDFYFLPIFFSLAFGPLIYFYTRSMTEREFSFQPRHGWHFLPVLIQASLYVFLQFQDYPFRRWFWMEVHFPYTYNLEFQLDADLHVDLPVPLYAGHPELSRLDQKSVFGNLSYQSELVKNGVGDHDRFEFFLVGRCLFTVLPGILPCSALFCYLHGRRHPCCWRAGSLLQSDLLGKGIVSTPSLPEASAPWTPDESLLQQIKTEMEKNQHYLNPDLSLETFAAHLQLPARQISTQINKGMGMPFIDFVNDFRVEEVKQHLLKQDLPHLSLLGIALESGFRSKSHF